MGMVVGARRGPRGVVVEAGPVARWAYDLDTHCTARPRPESLVYGGSQAPRLGADDAPSLLDDIDDSGDDE